LIDNLIHPPMKTILAPVDFSPISRRVLAEAVALANTLRARLVLLHVVSPPVLINEYEMMLNEVARVAAAQEKAAARHLARLAKALAPRVPAVAHACLLGSPARLVVEHAKKVSADYIVLGSHGHTAFHDLLVGSTAAGVLKHAKCPVVVVPPPAARKK
jgi:nucleotide-binding universal stress UspA family protein